MLEETQVYMMRSPISEVLVRGRAARLVEGIQNGINRYKKDNPMHAGTETLTLFGKGRNYYVVSR